MSSLYEEAALINVSVEWIGKQIRRVEAQIAVAKSQDNVDALVRLDKELDEFYAKATREDKILDKFIKKYKINT